MLHESGCLTLPCRCTSKRYTGTCSGEVVSSLMKQQPHQKSASFTGREKKESLTADEMAIKRVATYDKKADRVHGLVGLGGLENELGMENPLATHLLVFVGLSTHFGYYYSSSTTGE